MGQKLQRLRQAAGMSQSQLAKAANIPIGTLRNWEQDRRSPLLDTAGRVARSLGVSLDQLFEEFSQERPKVIPKAPPATSASADVEATAKKPKARRKKS
jgi:transcriptional regulator with XRE-family HTH domain